MYNLRQKYNEWQFFNNFMIFCKVNRLGVLCSAIMNYKLQFNVFYLII